MKGGVVQVAVKEYYRDSQGNLYYIIYANDGNIIQKTDMGVTSATPTLGDGGQELATSKACFFRFTVDYDHTTSKKLTEYTLELGIGQNTRIKYQGNCKLFLDVNNDTTSADRFQMSTINDNLTTKVNVGGNYAQVFTYRFKSAMGYVSRVAYANESGIYGVGVLISQRMVLDDGRVVWTTTGIQSLAAGTGYRKTEVFCTTNNEYMIWDSSKFKKIEDDETPDTKPDGGFGGGENPTDTVDFPPLPNINLNVTGSSLYALTESQMLIFTSWLWTSDWTQNIKKLRTDPMQNIIGVAITDVPVAGTDAKIVVGNVNSDKDAKIVRRWAEINCGTITANEFYGTFADYEPYVHYTLYLPKVGFVSIPADIVTNNNITVLYHIELSSGEGICYVHLQNIRNGFSYIFNTYSCQCCSNVALSASDHTAQIQASIQAGTSLLTSAIKGDALGMTTGAISGAVNVATAKNPTSTRGAMGNMSSLMSYKKPYILIEATYLTKPSGYKANNGHAIYFTNTLNNLSGFVKTMDYHTSFNCPVDVANEIETLLDGGVFID